MNTKKILRPWFALSLLSGVVVHAQTNWKAQTGAFTNAANWNNGLPTSATDTFITNGTGALPSVVNLGPAQNGFVKNLTLNSFGTLNVGLGSSLSLFGPNFVNSGSLNIVAGSGTNSVLGLNANTTLSGGGTITLNSGDNNGQAYIQQQVGGANLTNVDNTIQGYGVIGNGGLKLINSTAGTILANAAGKTLLINGTGGLTNNGKMQVDGGSTMEVVGNLPNNGKIVLGASLAGAGHLIETGNYTQTNNATLLDTIGSPFLNGKFDVTGNITLGGILDIELLNGFTPTTGELFTLMDFSGTENGIFSSIIGSDLGDWSVLYNPGNNGQVDLEFVGRPNTAVPDSGSCAGLGAVILLALVFVSRNRRQGRSVGAQ